MPVVLTRIVTLSEVPTRKTLIPAGYWDAIIKSAHLLNDTQALRVNLKDYALF